MWDYKEIQKVPKVNPTKFPKLEEQAFSTLGSVEILRFPDTILFKDEFGILDFSKYFGVFKIKTNWFWDSWSSPLGPKTMQMMGCRDFLK